MKKNKILITAGNTWAPLDDVRVITNIFSGETGILIANELAKNNFEVTLILADYRCHLKINKKIKLLRAISYHELYDTLKKEIKSQKYKAVIHAAAVSDFETKNIFKGKIKSKEKINILLTPTEKIVKKIKKWDYKTKLIMFKLESKIHKKELFLSAKNAQKSANAEMVIANKLPKNNKHIFYLIAKNKKTLTLESKKSLAKVLTDIIAEELF